MSRVLWLSATTAILTTWDSVISVDLASGQKRWEARGFRDLVTALSVSSDETLVIASDYYGTTRLLRFDDGTEVGTPLANGSMTAEERGTDPVVRASSSVFLPDSHVAALTDWDTGIVRFVDVNSRTEVSPPFTTVTGTSFPAISSDGAVLAVGGTGAAVRLFDVEARTPIGDPFPSSLSITAGSFTPDGRSMAVLDEPATLWDVDPASWREKACTVAGRNMTKLEWEQYMPPDEPYRATCPDLRIET
jgi:WD40 repeat protein